MRNVSQTIESVVAASVSHPRTVSTIGALLGLLAALYVSQFFGIRTDLDSLISGSLPWRVGEAQVAHEFRDQADDIAAVIDGDTPELAERAAALLADKMRQRGDLFERATRINGGPFFDREGLLFLPIADVRKATAQLIGAQPLLAPLAADPSLRGLLKSVDTGLAGVEDDPAKIGAVDYPVKEIDRVLSAVTNGRPAFLSWRSLISDRQADPNDRRQFIELIPRLDFSQMAPGEAAVAEVRQAVETLHLTPDNGVRVRLTGSVPMLDDEFSTLKETSGPIAVLAIVCMLGILYVALRSIRLIVCVGMTLTIGAAITSAAGLLLFGRFNLISVAFLPLFVGLGIDFAIQYCVRVRTENLRESDLGRILPRAGKAVGRGLALAATAISVGFFAFVPTHYLGVSELGLIAGLGIVIALCLTLTLLPALISLVGLAGSAPKHDSAAQFDADKQVLRFRKQILLGALFLAAAALFAVPFLKFDFDPLRMRSTKKESVATYLELAQTVETSPSTVNVLSPSPESAAVLAGKISALPEVARVITVDSFIPKDQAGKLALIEDARTLLDPSLNPFEIAPSPTDAELIKQLLETERHLRQTGARAASGSKTEMIDLADTLERLARGSPDLRSKAGAAVFAGFPTAMEQVNASLSAQPVTLDSLPVDIRRQWISAEGHALLQIFPKHQLSNPAVTATFVHAVQRVAPDISGVAVDVVESGQTILRAFFDAGLYSAIAIIALLFLALRNALSVTLAVTPVLLSGLLMFGTCVAIGLDVNLENMIALPLLLGIGVAFNIYFIVEWRNGANDLLKSSLTRAIIYSGLTTGTSFASLSFSSHPGTASMGILLLIALFWILITTLTVLPALLSMSKRLNRAIA
jgi:hopanoid biosynthesis associated RND transporter like protein HpnN